MFYLVLSIHKKSNNISSFRIERKHNSMKSANLGVISLSMLNIAAVLSVVNYPAQAEYGYAILFVIALSAILFFIPCALVSAEMASALPQNGGLYLWGKTAFNPAIGFMTVSMQWFNSLPWYGTVLTFIATSIAYMFDPRLSTAPWFVYLVILLVIWGSTLVNCLGISLYAKLSTIGVIVGTIVPTIIIILGAGYRFLNGTSPTIPFEASKLFPQLSNGNDWMLFAGMIVSLAGIDMTALHITDTKNPEKTYPMAILVSSVVIIIATVLGSLAIALTVTPQKLSMASGAGEAFQNVCDGIGMPWLLVPLCLMLALGGITTIFTWLLGPSKGLLEVAEEGYLPRMLSYKNAQNIPVPILVIQGIIISILSLVVFVMPSIGSAFWVFMALSAQMYMCMYILMFAAAFQLRRKHPELARPYKIPGGLWGMGIVCGFGILAAVGAIIAGFIPPSNIRSEGWEHCFLYSFLLGFGTLFFLSLPVMMLRYERKQHKI